jgi:hypothetical protein
LIENIEYSTVRIRNDGLEVFPSCPNCQVTLAEAKEVR